MVLGTGSLPDKDLLPAISAASGIREADLTPLAGYATRNFLAGQTGEKRVLKLYEWDEDLSELLDAEDRILNRLQGVEGLTFPVPRETRSGELRKVIDCPPGRFLLRTLSYVEGERVGDTGYSESILESLGRTLALIHERLSGLRLSVVESRKYNWDLRQFELSYPLLNHIGSARDRSLVRYFFRQVETFVRPRYPELPEGLLHGDANEMNIIAAEGRVRSLIDFGDVCHSHLVNDVAIAAAYALLEMPDPRRSLDPLLRGYASVRPLKTDEAESLYFLIASRLCISVCSSARSRVEDPGNEYALISEAPAWEFLRRWVRTNPLEIESIAREATGLPAKDAGDVGKELRLRRANTSGALSLHFERPVKMVRAAFQYMFDSEGRSYLDCYNNIPQVGHCHPDVTEALCRASNALNTNTRYLSDEFNDYSERLLSKFPGSLNKLFLVNSGSAASDLAIRLAMTHTGAGKIVVMEHGYHGNTRIGIDISHYKYAGRGGPGKREEVIEAELPDAYKGRFTGEGPGTGARYASDLAEKLSDFDGEIAAFIAEPVVGCGGQVPLAEGYLKAVYEAVRSLGGVCISDEVQTGFGRLGKWFWGYEMHGVVPDIVVLGKPIGNGHPMAAVVTTSEIAGSFETGMEFFSSFGGNNVSCAVGLAVLDVLEGERLPENAETVGGYLLDRLRGLVEKHEVCGDARGAGLFLGLELVTDKISKSPNTELAARVQNDLKDRGILVGTDGPHSNVIKIKPPICFSMDNADELLAALDAAISRQD